MKTSSYKWLKHMFFISKLAILTLVMIIMFLMLQTIQTAHAQGHTYHNNSYHGTAALAEKELRTKELKAKQMNEKYETNITANVTVNDEKEKECSKDPEKSRSSER